MDIVVTAYHDGHPVRHLLQEANSMEEDGHVPPRSSLRRPVAIATVLVAYSNVSAYLTNYAGLSLPGEMLTMASILVLEP